MACSSAAGAGGGGRRRGLVRLSTVVVRLCGFCFNSDTGFLDADTVCRGLAIVLALATPGLLLFGIAAVFSSGAVSDFLEVNAGLCAGDSGSSFSTTVGGTVLVGEVGLGGLVLLFSLGVKSRAVSDFLELIKGLCDTSDGASSWTVGGMALGPVELGGGGGLLRDLPEGVG